MSLPVITSRVETIDGPTRLSVTIVCEGRFADEHDWWHDRYTFRHRNPATGQSMQVTWRAGVMYGTPRPEDALVAFYRDIRWCEDPDVQSHEEAEKYARLLARLDDRARRFFGADYEQWMAWLDERDR